MTRAQDLSCPYGYACGIGRRTVYGVDSLLGAYSIRIRQSAEIRVPAEEREREEGCERSEAQCPEALGGRARGGSPTRRCVPLRFRIGDHSRARLFVLDFHVCHDEGQRSANRGEDRTRLPRVLSLTSFMQHLRRQMAWH
jgi:hypothetical protein